MLITNATCYSDSEIDAPNNNYPIVATSAGHHQLISRTDFVTNRPGRADYQLLYVNEGHMEYFKESQKFVAQAGSFILYHPNEAQHYQYFSKDHADIYWVHFTGYDVAHILSSLEFDKHTCYVRKNDQKYEYFFNEIIQELMHQRTHFMDFSSLLMHSLLLYISRTAATKKIRHNHEMRDVVSYVEQLHEYLLENYTSSINFSELAKFFHISLSQLSKAYSYRYGISPSRQLIHLRMEKAKILLLSNMSIKEAAENVGYMDQLYFSRLFHKLYGMTPSQFKTRNLNTCKVTDLNGELLIKRKNS